MSQTPRQPSNPQRHTPSSSAHPPGSDSNRSGLGLAGTGGHGGSGLGDTSPLSRSRQTSEDTVPLQMPSFDGPNPDAIPMPVDDDRPRAKAPATKSEADDAQEAAKHNTNVDTLVARLVIDNGLALEEEVQQCLARLKQIREEAGASSGSANSASLMQILVENDYITKRQVARLKQIAEAERSGHKIPGYKFLGKLGAGAMATVHKAKQLALDRYVAIKILPKKFTSNPQFIERFYLEGRSAAQLNHPNIVTAIDVGKAGDYHYFVMEFVDGRTVYDDIVKHKRFAEKDAIDIAVQTAEALQHAHDKGLIHRDVKPKNIMITKEGVVKLADMGLARAVSDKEAAEAEAGKAFGTPYYISPEQIRGEVNIGPPADIYSLGATLYHMVTGNVPFDGKNPSAVMHKHLKADLVAPDHVNPKLSAGIAEIIEMMMAKDPRKRYQTCKDLLVDLRAVRKQESPPIAHKDAPPATDIASIMKAEEQAASEMAVVPDTLVPAGTMLRQPLFIMLAVVAVVSVLFNVFLLLKQSSS